MNETITVKDGQAAVATTAVSGTLSPKSSATDIITVVKTADGDQAAVKVVDLGGGSGGGGDYLPLSGGTMTGLLELTAEKPASSFDSGSFLKIIQVSSDGTKRVFDLTVDSGAVYMGGLSIGGVTGLIPARDGLYSVGGYFNKWNIVYTSKLNNGEDIAVPTEGGTMARIEDIDEAVGNISTLLDTINGEVL